jgi:PBP1b-binding outer membrane lipoprotein LpoB
MNIFLKKFITLILLIFFIQGCSTAVTVVDEAATTTTKVVVGTVKGVMHITTCPFTEKKCF